ncbi:hypothetical protein Dsin_012639 [Dipteronia sinensis]|uniref:Uncharacterized protein n=1 Tax=Dipteronia sinensis TaxID=43782 RepID=A0AAE0AJM0_9ROSI|nr:hypothetical protein Dsin_012639 [Dipteronia sinensis]
MGTCLSKKKDATLSVSSKTVAVDPVKPDDNTKNVAQKQQPRKSEEEGLVKKEIFVIKHRKSHEKKEASVVEEEMGNNVTKEEVDAILIQCGRLSRSNSSGTGKSRKYSGSKRSYDFDHNDVDRVDDDSDSKKKVSDEDDEKQQHRQRHRQSSPSSQGRRRRTPSREREREQQRSASRESSGRRVSRSPGRRSETNNTVTNNNRPGKMVSVPASVTSLVMDKNSNSNEPSMNANGIINRVSVKRNAASPRSQSPARANTNLIVKSSNENQQQPSLSRSSSRKAEHSPYRRNPLGEIDPNSLAYPTTNANRGQNRNRETEGDGILVTNQGGIQKPEIVAQGKNHKTSNRGGTMNNKVVITNCLEREHQRTTGNSVVTLTTASGAENHQKPQTVTRSRSSRLSRDLDINPVTLMNPSPSYTTLLLEDIHNFHQKNNNTPTTPSISLPACVSKACSIVDAVADLNSSTTSSNLVVGKKMPESNYRDPYVESEVLGNDDLMEPSFHKYVTVRRGGATLQGVDLDDQESSGSNSVAGGSQQNWSFSTSSWEPNSAESTDRWTSRSNTRDENPLGFQRSETGCDARKGFSGTTKRDNDYEKAGIGRGRIGTGKGLHTVPVGVAAST